MRALLFASLILALTACSDDTSIKQDSGADSTVKADKGLDAPKGPDAKGDSGQPDQGQPDSSTIKKLLTKTNHSKGYSKTNCAASGCHTLPVTKGSYTHTETKSPQCVTCHGANGACDANGINSGKKNHTKGMGGCTGCHSGKGHGYSSNSDCVSCHFAPAGMENCP